MTSKFTLLCLIFIVLNYFLWTSPIVKLFNFLTLEILHITGNFDYFLLDNFWHWTYYLIHLRPPQGYFLIFWNVTIWTPHDQKYASGFPWVIWTYQQLCLLILMNHIMCLGSQTKVIIQLWYDCMTCAKLCKYLFYVPKLFTPIDASDIYEIGCFRYLGVAIIWWHQKSLYHKPPYIYT